MFVVALLVVAALLFAVSSVGSLASSGSRETTYFRDVDEAVYVAESGLNHAKWKVMYHKTEIAWSQYPDGAPSLTCDSPETQGVLPVGASYRVWLWPHPTDGNIYYAVVVSQVGLQGHRLRTTLEIPPPFNSGGGDGGDEIPTGDDDADPPEFDTSMAVPFPLEHMTQSEELTLTEPYYIADDVQMDSWAKLFVDPAVPVVYVFIRSGGDLQINANCEVNWGGTSKLVFILLPPPDGEPATSSVFIESNTQVNALVWSDDATVHINKNSTVTGSVIGEYQSNSAVPTYSEEYANIPWPDGTIIDPEFGDIIP